MSWDLVLRHCAAIRATLDQTRVGLELQSAQLAGLEAFARHGHEREQAAQATTIERPERCVEVVEEDCALCSEDARVGGSLANHQSFMCRGCGATSSDGVTVAI